MSGHIRPEDASVADLYRIAGRVEEKMDRFLEGQTKQDAQIETLDKRVDTLDLWKARLNGALKLLAVAIPSAWAFFTYIGGK